MGIAMSAASAGITLPIAQLPKVLVDGQTAKASFTFIIEGFINGPLASGTNYHIFEIPGYCYLRFETSSNQLLFRLTKSDGNNAFGVVQSGLPTLTSLSGVNRVLIAISYDVSDDKIYSRLQMTGISRITNPTDVFGGTAFGSSVGSTFRLPGVVTSGGGQNGWNGVLSFGCLLNKTITDANFDAMWAEQPFELLRAVNGFADHADLDALFFMGTPAVANGSTVASSIHYYARTITASNLAASTVSPSATSGVTVALPWPNPKSVGGMDLSSFVDFDPIDVGGEDDAIAAYLPVWQSVVQNTFTGTVGVFGRANSRDARTFLSQSGLSGEMTPYSSWAGGFYSQLYDPRQLLGSAPGNMADYVNWWQNEAPNIVSNPYNTGLYTFNLAGSGAASGQGPPQMEFSTPSGTLITTLADNSQKRWGFGSTNGSFGPGVGIGLVNTAEHRVTANMLTGSAFTRNFHLIRGAFGGPGLGTITVKREKVVFVGSVLTTVVAPEVVDIDTTVVRVVWEADYDSVDGLTFTFGSADDSWTERNAEILAGVTPGMLMQNTNRSDLDEVVSVERVGNDVVVTFRFGGAALGTPVDGGNISFGPMSMHLFEFKGSWAAFGSDAFVFHFGIKGNGDGQAAGSCRIPLAGAGLLTHASSRPSDRTIWCVQCGWGGYSFTSQANEGWTDNFKVVTGAFGSACVLGLDATQGVAGTPEAHRANWEKLIDSVDEGVDVVLCDDVVHNSGSTDIFSTGGSYPNLQAGAILAANANGVGFVPTRNKCGDLFRHYSLQFRQDNDHIYSGLTSMLAYHALTGIEFAAPPATGGGAGYYRRQVYARRRSQM